MSERDAVEVAYHFDRDRAHYVKEFLGRDVLDPLLYTLQINTGEVPMADAVRLVRELVEAAA